MNVWWRWAEVWHRDDAARTSMSLCGAYANLMKAKNPHIERAMDRVQRTGNPPPAARCPRCSRLSVARSSSLREPLTTEDK